MKRLDTTPAAMTPRVIDTVLFDGDDTLWDYQRSMRGALGLVLQELWSRRPSAIEAGLDVDRLVDIRQRVASELDGRVVDLRVIRLAAFERTLEEIGQPDAELAAQLASSFYAHRHRLMQPIEGAAGVLDELSRTYRLGLVTNGNVDPAHFGFDEMLPVVVSAVSAGFAKPDPRIFAPALRALGSVVERTVYVGDSVADDVRGAQAAGMRSVWLNPAGHPDPQPAPDYTIRRLVDLPQLLATATDLSGA